MTDITPSPAPNANIPPTGAADISPTSMPADSMAEVRQIRTHRPLPPRRNVRRIDEAGARELGWPAAIAAATAAVVVVWALGRWAAQTALVDEVVSAVTPAASDEKRAQARRNAQAMASPGDWLSTVLEHHRDIEAAFAATRAAAGPSRITEMKRLRTILTAHSIAEEAVIYPAMREAGEKGHAAHAYNEQAMAKTEMAKLEKIDPASAGFAAKLEEIRAAVTHHMYEEEAIWLPMLKKRAPAGEQSRIAARFLEEFQRYAGATA
jgi:hypothetical protein